ncbi:conserved oligomeric Golgi complex subunit 2 isoform X2 [Cephus cinctus]|uniref:Conserved oligomeric Golgi complex subunit 2 n=1 Tax=Cephus cinctus TaxID=211228 RepID=A0AAJ7FK16_CEPCN|nr:conserved oligomeric Golgi complex subunit 2 isoform X2 [Cephus cinctus]
MTEHSFTLPRAPKELMFNEHDFNEKDFDVDKFLQEHRKNASLETMRDDLGIYLKVLRSAMIELINKDYVDFVSLSSNLIGLDKAINNLQVPLGQLREELMQVRQTLDDAITELTIALINHQRIRERKKSLQSLARVYKSIAKLSQILATSTTTAGSLKPDLLERAATEFNQLKFHTSRCKSDIAPIQSQSFELEQHLTAILDDSFILSIKNKQTNLLVRHLRIYITLDKIADAENLVRKKIVGPAVDNIIHKTNLQSEPLGLQGIFQRLLNVLNEELDELLIVTSHPDRMIVKGFNFLINSYWSEVEEKIELDMSSIFAPGHPEQFYRRYMETLEFLSKLEERCSNFETLAVLKNHTQYKQFLKKWNLPVYFQIRFQEVATAVESVLCEPISPTSIIENANNIHSMEYSLYATHITFDSLLRGWAEGVFLPQLLHRFWKLSLQICSRYKTWCRSTLTQNWPIVTGMGKIDGNEAECPTRLQFLVCLYTDIEKFIKQLPTLLEIVRIKLPNDKPSIMRILEDCLKETCRNLEDCLPAVTDEVVKELLSQSAVHLKQVSDIPRLFRRTKRDIPTKPCAYVNNALNPLSTFHTDYKTVIPKAVSHWIHLTLSSLTVQYLSSVTDVLTSVQKTEESLKRLKKIRDKSAGMSPSEGKGISDDAKIRIQLEIDVYGYKNMIETLDADISNVPHLQDLIHVVEAAVKNKDEQ